MKVEGAICAVLVGLAGYGPAVAAEGDQDSLEKRLLDKRIPLPPGS